MNKSNVTKSLESFESIISKLPSQDIQIQSVFLNNNQNESGQKLSISDDIDIDTNINLSSFITEKKNNNNNTDQLSNSDEFFANSDNMTIDSSNNNYYSDIINYDYTTSTKPCIQYPSPYKEIIRYNIVTGLNNYFQLKLKELPNKIYNTNELFKNNSCKLIELINRWCWHQYNIPTHMDEVIPYVSDNNYDYERFVDDLNYILEVHGTNNAIKIDDKIIMELKKLINEYLCVEYTKFKSRDNIQIKVSKDFIEKKIRLLCSYKQNTYHVIIYPKVYIRLKTKLIMFGKKYDIMKNYNDNLDELLDQYIFCLYFRYSYMDSGNQQLAINQSIKDMYKECGIDFELFGSAINTVSNNYCSLFYDIEKFFGSNGNFFDLQINKGVYWCNPPYDDTIMRNTGKKIVEALNSDKEVAFLVTIPIWDIQTQNLMKEENINNIMRNINTNTVSEQHTDFQIYSILKPYIKDELIIPKHRIPYFNYKKFSHINAVNTYMLIIYNKINNNVAKNLHSNFDQIIELDKKNFFCRN